MTRDLTAAQRVALDHRFGDVLDVAREIGHAREYLESGAARRTPKNLSRFCWNWCRTAEERRLNRMPAKERAAIERSRGPMAREAEVRAASMPPLSAEQLRAIADDPGESQEMRELARAELAALGKRS